MSECFSWDLERSLLVVEWGSKSSRTKKHHMTLKDGVLAESQSETTAVVAN